MADIKLQDLWKHYGEVQAVRGISLDIKHNEFVALVGPSGCGKTTTLRMIAGLEDITGGMIQIGGKIVNEVPPKDRDIAMVFQNYALYPHMNVYKNMSFGLQIRKTPQAEIDERVNRAAEILNIGELLERRPKELSGGQRQRVAMGRAIVRDPVVFLFDEPLSNLDAKLRVQMRTEIKKIHQRVQTTVVYVTHDQIEAMTLADRIVVMNDGLIEQVGTPDEMYSQPKTRFVASFIGSPSMNFAPCQLVKTAGGLAVRLTDELSLPVPADREARYGPYADKDMIFGIRPEHITERRAHAGGAQHDFDAKVDVLEPMGIDTMVFFAINGTDICARAEPTAVSSVGESMGFTVNMDKMHLMDPATDVVL
ncbi:MAG: sn-glycerol-3-phosphate ABC transporter ATP-binding protein UgpC [Rhodospirillaceae bacterium]|jgi:multiple sugar transport system ATP-binding protein|nr:sn-glycerol-3-phosphate ABC transporter ATP-binding protein UgpC [Rhodospirillaceae bacterium]MBT5667697.1 sn-glycerol-3-phosphate ABC transporter ATP-binding protein UgpC [Rhodospirillaceae bacterium]